MNLQVSCSLQMGSPLMQSGHCLKSRPEIVQSLGLTSTGLELAILSAANLQQIGLGAEPGGGIGGVRARDHSPKPFLTGLEQTGLASRQ
jgi:hypothetical protein